MIQTQIHEIIGQRKNGGERITLRSLAHAAGIEYTTLWRWANGQIKSTNHELLDALCRELNVTPGDLLVYVPEAAVPADGRDGQHEVEHVA